MPAHWSIMYPFPLPQAEGAYSFATGLKRWVWGLFGTDWESEGTVVLGIPRCARNDMIGG